MTRSRAGTPVFFLLLLALASGACGKRGPLKPPEPRGPTPPKEVAARQTGDRVVVSFVAPVARGDRPSQQPVRAELVRVTYAPGLHPPQDPDAFRRVGAVVATLERDPLAAGSRLRLEDPSYKELAGGGVDWTLRYAVRVRDRKGRPSPLVVAPDLLPVTPPPVPSGVHAEATADGIRVRWDPPKVEGIPKYNLYRAEQGADFGDLPLHREPLSTTEYLDTDVAAGKSYRYVVRTAMSEGPPFRESAPSVVAGVVAEDRFPPAAPSGLVAVQEGKAVRLFWNPNQERDLAGYRVYRRDAAGEWRRIGPELGVEPLLLDPEARPGTQVSYRVTAVDRAGNESIPSEPVDLDVAADAGAAPGGAR
jgi:predicted small lipoprotein YifL